MWIYVYEYAVSTMVVLGDALRSTLSQLPRRTAQILQSPSWKLSGHILKGFVDLVLKSIILLAVAC